VRAVRQFSLFAVADILGLGIGVLVSPITTRLLTPSQYGAVPILAAIWAVFSLMQYGGMDWAFPFFRSRPDIYSAEKVRATSTRIVLLAVLLTWSLFGLWLFWTDYGQSNAHMSIQEVVLYFLSIPPSAFIGWQLYIMRYELQAAAFARLSVFGRVFPPLLAIPMMVMVDQEHRLALNLLAGCIVSWIVCWWGSFTLKRAGLSASRAEASLPLAKVMLRYGIVLVPAAVVYSLFTVVDRILLGYYRTPEEVAVYMLAINVGGIALLIKVWFGRIFDPYLIRWVENRRAEEYMPKLQDSLDLIALIMTVLTLLAVFWSGHLFSLLYPDAYKQSAEVVPLVVLAGAISSLSLIFVASPLMSQKTMFHLPIYSLGLIVNSISGFILIPRIGVSGAVWGTLLGETVILLAWIATGRWILRNLRLKMLFSMSLLSFAFVACILYANPTFLQSTPVLESIILSIVLCVFTTTLFFLLLRRSEWIRKSFRPFLQGR
jgi:O-antigen/teichoic acid export membrane protein